MCCFLVPLTQAVVTTAYRKLNSESIKSSHSFRREIPALEKMLWGGSIMLIVDHIINGEVRWKFPFFTALAEVGGAEVFWKEIVSVGIPMSLVLTLVWVGYAFLKVKKKALPASK